VIDERDIKERMQLAAARVAEETSMPGPAAARRRGRWRQARIGGALTAVVALMAFGVTSVGPQTQVVKAPAGGHSSQQHVDPSELRFYRDDPLYRENPPTGPIIIAAEGRQDGVHWRVLAFRAKDERVCRIVEVARGSQLRAGSGGGSCGPADPNHPSGFLIGTPCPFDLIGGEVAKHVAKVRVVLIDGRHLEAAPIALRDLPHNLYIITAARPPRVDHLIVRETIWLDTQGRPLCRVRAVPVDQRCP
jgi:hypothetical protein